MSDWKSRIDAWEANKHRKVEEKAKRRQEQAEHRRKTDTGAMPKRRWGQVQTLAVHQRRFRCHICRKPSDGPQTYDMVQFAWVATRKIEDDSYRQGIEYMQHVNWDYPTGLSKCSKCHAWTCVEHVYKGMCQTCADKL